MRREVTSVEALREIVGHPNTYVANKVGARLSAVQQDWLAHMKENCQFCHQLGTKITRELRGLDRDPLKIPGAHVDENAKPCAERLMVAM